VTNINKALQIFTKNTQLNCMLYYNFSEIVYFLQKNSFIFRNGNKVSDFEEKCIND